MLRAPCVKVIVSDAFLSIEIELCLFSHPMCFHILYSMLHIQALKPLDHFYLVFVLQK